jgi:hypothetical protein
MEEKDKILYKKILKVKMAGGVVQVVEAFA